MFQAKDHEVSYYQFVQEAIHIASYAEVYDLE